MSYPKPTPAELADLRQRAEHLWLRRDDRIYPDSRQSEVLLELIAAYESVHHPDYFQRLCLRTVNVQRAAEKLGIQVTSHNRYLLTLLLCEAGIAGEGGEIAEPIKKFVFHGKDLDVPALSKEIGDVLWYLAVLADAIGYPLSRIMAENVAKLEARHLAKQSEEVKLLTGDVQCGIPAGVRFTDHI